MKYNFKITVFYVIDVICSVMAKLNFQCHMSLQKLFQYADLVLRKDYLLLMLKTDVWLNILCKPSYIFVGILL